MKKVLSVFLISLFVCFQAWSKSLDQKELEIKKIYAAGGITADEYNKAKSFLKNSQKKNKEKKSKQTFNLIKKKKSKSESQLIFEKFKKKDENKEEVTLKKVEELGHLTKLDNTYFPDGMIKEFKGCSNSFKCKGSKAGQYLSMAFKKGKGYGQRNPGRMIKAMAMFEVFYAQSLWSAKKHIERYKANNYEDKKISLYSKKKDEKKIRSLFGMNKGRKGMREALGMNMETPTKEAIKNFWVLGEFLDLGVAVKNKKLDKDLKERQKLIEAYRAEISKLRKKLQNDLDEEENEKSVE